MIKPIAICKNDKIFKHSGNWNNAFIKCCEEQNIPFELVDCYRYDIVDKLDRYSALIWTIQNYVLADIQESRSILQVAEQKGLKTFPNHNTVWHFDDKIAEMYQFQAVKAPIPRSWVFYLLEDCLKWLDSAQYPIIAKLRCGSGSNNVRMLKSKGEAVSYAKKMFSSGFDPSPSLMYKAYSKAQSSKNWKMAASRIKKIPEFLNTRRHASQLPIEKGYCYFQEMIPNDGYDIKVAVVGDKLSFLVRHTRKNDFRASGGGNIFYDKKYMTPQIIESAFKTAEAIGTQCIGFDYVVDKRNGVGKIIEMCYGFDWEAVFSAGGYWDRNAVWHDEPLNVPNEILKNLLKSIEL